MKRWNAPLLAAAAVLASLCAAGCEHKDGDALTSPLAPFVIAPALKGSCDGSGNLWSACSAGRTSAQELSAAAVATDGGSRVFDGAR